MNGRILPRHGSTLTDEGMEAKVEAVMTAGDIGVEAVHTILMN